MSRCMLYSAAFLLLSPLALHGVTADGAMWDSAARAQNADVSLEEIRGFYKLMPMQTPRGSNTRAVGNGIVSLTFGPEPRDITIHGCRWQLSHAVKTDDKGDLLLSRTDVVNLIDPILRPTYIANRRIVKTIVLDPGHGGHDAGTNTPLVREADVVLLVANKMAAILKERGYHVLLTHDVNRYMSDQQRLDSVKNALNPIFISLHLNSGRSDVQGAQTYTPAPAEPGKQVLPVNAHDAANAALAMSLQAAMVTGAGATDAGCHRMHYSMLNSLSCPAAHVELGYATNEEEATKLNTDEYQTKLATALADGITRFAGVMNPEMVLKARPAPVVQQPEPVKVDAPAKKAKPAPERKKRRAVRRTIREAQPKRRTPTRRNKRRR